MEVYFVQDSYVCIRYASVILEGDTYTVWRSEGSYMYPVEFTTRAEALEWADSWVAEVNNYHRKLLDKGDN